MDRAEIIVDAPPRVVWDTLADPHTFKYWVVGCKDVRHVEGDWPATGSAIHHSVGIGPATIDDTTTVVESEPNRHLALRARARPVGVAVVDITMQPADDGGTCVVMEERVVEGAASHVPDALTDVALHPRNKESLRRLKDLAEQRATG